MIVSLPHSSRDRLKRIAERSLPASLMRRLRLAKFRRERTRFPERVVSHHYGGRPLRIAIGSPYGERYDRDWEELPEVAFLKRHRLRPGARVFNLGANHGVVALMLADAVGPDGSVVALEAHPSDAAMADRNRRLNQTDQLRCLHAAVARTSGRLTFGLNGEVDDGTARWADQPVPAWSIDDLARDYGVPDVVFMDVEGYEHEALAGAADTLAARPDWFVEVHAGEQLSKYGGSVESVLESFDTAAYELHAAADGLRFFPGGATSQTTFAPIDRVPPAVLESRFFLIAIARR